MIIAIGPTLSKIDIGQRGQVTMKLEYNLLKYSLALCILLNLSVY